VTLPEALNALFAIAAKLITSVYYTSYRLRTLLLLLLILI